MASGMQRFTQRCRVVLQLTQQAAERLGSNTIDTEHLLIGLATEPHGVAGQALRALGVNITTIEAALGNNAPERPHPIAKLDLSKDVRRVLEYSVNEARKMRLHTIYTEHLLMGMLRLKSCRGIQVLEKLHVSSEQVQNQIRAILKTPRPAEIDSPDGDPPQQAETQYIQQAADASIKHVQLIYNRISRRKQWPNATMTVVIGFIGTVLSVAWSQVALELTMRYPVLMGLRIAIDVASWLTAILLPPLAAVLSAQIVMRDIEQETTPLLLLTNLNARSLMWGYVRGMMYRLRLLLPAIMIVIPLLVASIRELPSSLYQLMPSTLNTPNFFLVTMWFITPSFFLTILLGFAWLGIAMGTTLPFKIKEAFAASAVASLATLVGLLLSLVTVISISNMLFARQITANRPLNPDDASAILLVPGISAFVLGLVFVRLGQRWIAPDADYEASSDPPPKHPLDR